MSSPAFSPETTPSSSNTISITPPDLTMPPEIDIISSSPPSIPPQTTTTVTTSSPPPLPSPSVSEPETSPPAPPLSSSPPSTLPALLPPPLISPPDDIPQIPPVSAVTPPPDSSPLPPAVTPPPATTTSQPPSTLPTLPENPSPSTPAVVIQNPPSETTPSPLSSPTTPITTDPPPQQHPHPHHHRRTPTTTTPTTNPSPDPPTDTPPTPTTTPSRSSPNTPDSNPQQPIDNRVHDHPPFPPQQASAAPPQTSTTSSPPPGTIPESEMPLFPSSSAPEPHQPQLPNDSGYGGGRGGVIGSQPATSVLPIGVDMGSSGLAGRRSSSSTDARVPTGVVVGLGVGGVVLVLLLVFGILVVFFRKKRDGDGFCKNGMGDIEAKSSFHRYSKQNRTSEDHHNSIWGNNTSSTIPKHTLPAPPVVVTSSTRRNPSNSALDGSGGGSNHAMGGMNFSVVGGSTFTYDELSSATGGFSDSNLLGKGGFGYVFKGVLPNGKQVAVKQLILGGHQGEREFQAEVETISQVHHKHLVSLVGYCIAGDERLLVYDFVPNNTLDFHLHGKDQEVMPWSRRLKIAIGAGKGLAYLHEDCNPTIIHRDIKAANILLDFNGEAKVSDFGLAKIFSNTNADVTHVTTRVMGTFGYLAPEYASSGKLTDKSDVYSYGVMLLELITGRPPITHTAGSEEMNGSLVNWARPLLAQAIEEGEFHTLVDPRLDHNYNNNEMASMVSCAAACIRLSAWRRPRMCQVVRALEGDLSPSNLDDGVRPGQSPYDDSDFDTGKYLEEMKRFKMALGSSGGGSFNRMRTENNTTSNNNNYVDNSTSEYGLNPSVSSYSDHHAAA